MANLREDFQTRTNYAYPEKIDKPNDEREFIVWLTQTFGYDHNKYVRYYNNSAIRVLRDNLEASEMWRGLNDELRNINVEYESIYGSPLMETPINVKIYEKSLESLIIKAFRKDVLNNKNFPKAPDGGWILPENWFSCINDILRTTIVVRYIDGVDFLLQRLAIYMKRMDCVFGYGFEARDNGYYAAHSGARIKLVMPLYPDLDDVTTNINVEIQVTTQLQTIIKDLLHKYYEKDRKREVRENYMWQWDYKCEQFSTNYLGHIVHYVEGMVVDIRDKQRESD